jgi:spore maturation protein CgeB
MRIAIFCHSLLSDWNHGNAHFLRGISTEVIARGHDVRVFEPRGAWSLENLIREQGARALVDFHTVYPGLESSRYDPQSLDLDEALDGCHLVLVHEWNEPDLVRRIGEHRRKGGRYRLLFHDTHHRSATDHENMTCSTLDGYDGVLAFGDVIRERYVCLGWARRAWTWHEAADTRVFRPFPAIDRDLDLVWIGNWGDEERTAELHEFLIKPAAALGLRARMYGVRYPESARVLLREAGIEYAGWLPNYVVPRVFARARVTLHIPRRPYVDQLPGVPTIRVFEALACGIPLVCSQWEDVEQLFTPGADFLQARDGSRMQRAINDVLNDAALAQELASHGRRTILKRHTCGHRVDELLRIYEGLVSADRPDSAAPVARPGALSTVAEGVACAQNEPGQAGGIAPAPAG